MTKDERSSTGRDVGANPINDTDEYEEPEDATPTDANTENPAETESEETESDSIEELSEVEFENSDLAEAA